jgi:hypothetical protein
VAVPPSSRRRPLRLLAGLLVPVACFLVLLRLVGDATEALAITDGIPLLWLVGYAIWRRRIEPVGAVVAAIAALALLLTIALGGSPLPLELHRALFPGVVGLTCLTSLAVRQPLLQLAKTKLAKNGSEATAKHRPPLDTPDSRHTLAVLTAIIGLTLSTDAAAQVTLALTVSTATFGVVAHMAAWAIIGVGLAVCVLYLRWTHRRQHHRTSPPGRESETPGSPSPSADAHQLLT